MTRRSAIGWLYRWHWQHRGLTYGGRVYLNSPEDRKNQNDQAAIQSMQTTVQIMQNVVMIDSMFINQ